MSNCSLREGFIDLIKNASKIPNKQLEPAKHLKYFPDHQFEWKVLTRAPEYTRKRKILEAFLIKSINPSLNEQLDTELLVLFRNGVA